MHGIQVVEETNTKTRIQRYTSGQAGAGERYPETCGPCHIAMKLLRSPPMGNTRQVERDDACIVNIL